MATGGVKNAAMTSGRGLAKARNQGASYAKGGMIAMPQASVAPFKKKSFGKFPPAKGPGMKSGGKC